MVSPTEVLSNAITETLLELNLTDFRVLDNIYSFTQWWGSTALGFSGRIGGQAFTKSTTVVIQFKELYFVYFNSSLAYKVESPSEMFFQDLLNFNMVSTDLYEKRYLNNLSE